ncbi:uncharacterized protein LOC132795386 [Drosophila nasuta]|uniref:uncharacterized protein LOC132795386 n=1 Tax=Drosophila nasuta TaxID=42062 RepID=UPI00295ED929|nr:uncharacterized protein LOC132795386 [Drosophila nasuta]
MSSLGVSWSSLDFRNDAKILKRLYKIPGKDYTNLVKTLKNTPTSLVLKDYVNHELVPILTMDPNARLAPVYTPAATANPADSQQLSSPLLEGLSTTPTQSQAKGGGGVYTLTEETELELQAVHTAETQVERV